MASLLEQAKFQLSVCEMAASPTVAAPFSVGGLAPILCAFVEMAKALTDAGEAIHSEFCGGRHSSRCVTIERLLDRINAPAQESQ